ncbi:transporter [Sulfurovum sp. CS9]|uniref:SphA family protein n=1 Tax=Sulfurovum sp. CS9 TaxID=3391146 RepID=UPI0039EA61B6
MKINKKFSNFIKTGLCTLALASTVVVAEEGGSGHYLPGSMASFMDGVALEPTFLMRLNYINYQASSSVTIPKSSGGLLANPAATSNVLGLTLFWAPDWNLGLGDKWQFAMSTTIPVLNLDLSGDFTYRGTDFGDMQGDRTALGDIVLMPLMLNYNVSKDLNINTRIGIYAPTGSYELGRFINNGKNFWTVEPTIGIMYFGQENGIEASLFLGADFNWENPDTNYKSGTQIHLDGTLAQHFPFAGGITGVGVNAYWYKQVTDDSGEGANLGAFRAKALGAGPVLSWIDKKGKYLAELKYLKDYQNEKRLESDTLWFKFIVNF